MEGAKRVNNLVDDDEETLEDPMLERGWEYQDQDESVRGIYPSEVIYQWWLRGCLPKDQVVREVGREGWSLLISHKKLLRQRAIARTAWKLFHGQPQMLWYYRDSKDEVQGSFTGKMMWKWFEGGLLYQSLLVSVMPGNGSDIVKEDLEFLGLDKLLEAYLLEDGLKPHELLAVKVREKKEVQRAQESVKEVKKSDKGLRGDKSDFLDMPLEKLVPISMRLWMPKESGEVEWFFTERQVIYGPYSGPQMYMWFCEGRLPEGLKIYSREKRTEDEELLARKQGKEQNVKMSFVTLSDALYSVAKQVYGIN